jgi:hypothetical protein
MRLIFAVCSLLLLGSTSVSAQTTQPNYFKDTSLYLAEHLSNLNKLGNEMTGISVLTDRLAVDNLIYDFNQLNYDVTNLYQLSLIRASMLNTKDKKVIDEFIGIAKNRFSKDCDFGVTDINQLLASVQHPAALAESKQLRDKVVEACDYVKGVK